MDKGKQLFNKLSKKGRDFLGIEYPVLCGAMSWISNHQLVSAISNAGGFGVLAGGNMPVELFAEEIRKTRELTSKPFGVNMITIAPNFSAQLDYACKIKSPVVIFAGGLPPRDAYGKAKDAGCSLICFAPSLKAVEMHTRLGADAIIIEGHEAGGHIGPVSTSVLAEQILPQVKDVPVFVAGGIGSDGALHADGSQRHPARHKVRRVAGIACPSRIQGIVYKGYCQGCAAVREV